MPSVIIPWIENVNKMQFGSFLFVLCNANTKRSHNENNKFCVRRANSGGAPRKRNGLFYFMTTDDNRQLINDDDDKDRGRFSSANSSRPPKVCCKVCGKCASVFSMPAKCPSAMFLLWCIYNSQSQYSTSCTGCTIEVQWMGDRQIKDRLKWEFPLADE